MGLAASFSVWRCDLSLVVLGVQVRGVVRTVVAYKQHSVFSRFFPIRVREIVGEGGLLAF